MVKVSYDGEFPCACSGKLVVEVDGKVVFSEGGCCRSTGCVWFDKDWQEHVEKGELLLDVEELTAMRKDLSWLTPEVDDAIKEVLSKVHVCCGGCV